jgi:hypothetical protein
MIDVASRHGAAAPTPGGTPRTCLQPAPLRCSTPFNTRAPPALGPRVPSKPLTALPWVRSRPLLRMRPAGFDSAERRPLEPALGPGTTAFWTTFAPAPAHATAHAPVRPLPTPPPSPMRQGQPPTPTARGPAPPMRRPEDPHQSWGFSRRCGTPARPPNSLFLTNRGGARPSPFGRPPAPPQRAIKQTPRRQAPACRCRTNTTPAARPGRLGWMAAAPSRRPLLQMQLLPRRPPCSTLQGATSRAARCLRRRAGASPLQPAPPARLGRLTSAEGSQGAHAPAYWSPARGAGPGP